jgi:ribonuclease HI
MHIEFTKESGPHKNRDEATTQALAQFEGFDIYDTTGLLVCRINAHAAGKLKSFYNLPKRKVERPTTSASSICTSNPNFSSNPFDSFAYADTAAPQPAVSTVDSAVSTAAVNAFGLDTILNVEGSVSADSALSDALIKGLLRLDTSVLLDVFSTYDTAIACVDGAFKDGVQGYGFVLIAGGTCYRDSGTITNLCGSSIRAELMAVRQALAKAMAFGVKNLIVCYDCMAVTTSIESDSKSTLPEVVEYRKFYKVASELMNIKFVKVTGHSGVPLHTSADVMAGLRVGRII